MKMMSWLQFKNLNLGQQVWLVINVGRTLEVVRATKTGDRRLTWWHVGQKEAGKEDHLLSEWAEVPATDKTYAEALQLLDHLRSK
jgi:hypothetical protein